MFLNENYVLANEIVQQRNVRIGNISQLVRNLENKNLFESYQKRGNCTFLNSKSNYLGGMQEHVKSGSFTDISNKLPLSYLLHEFGISKKELLSSLKEYIKGECSISNKNFIIFKDSFVKKLKGKTIYIMKKGELDDAISNNYIDGYIEINKNKFIVFY